jgi:hypothetical protein
VTTDAPSDAVTVDRSPGRTSATVATAAAVVAGLLLPASAGLAFALPGAGLLALGALGGYRTGVGYGATLLLAGVAVTGALGAPPESLALATLLALVAWDAGRYGIAVGEQLGRAASTSAVELAHAGLTTAVGAAGLGLGYAAYRVAAGSATPGAVVALVAFGAVVLVATLR